VVTLKEKHRATWASGDYASVADRLLPEVGRYAVVRAGVGPGMEVLDVACGTGNATLPAAAAGARVVGLDLTPELLDEARLRAVGADLEIELVEGDAEDLPFEDDRFDRVLSVFGVQFAPRHEASARELVRVCKPGRLVVLCNWTPEGFIGRVFKTLGPYLPTPPDYASPPPEWGSEPHVEQLFEGLHVDLHLERRTVDFRHESPDAFVDFMADSYGPLKMARAALDPEGRWDDLRSELVGMSKALNRDAPAFLAPSEYLVVVARRAD
jgi:SAM-dependent methyltransferase